MSLDHLIGQAYTDEELERELRECLARLHAEYTRMAKPYIDALVRIESMRMPRYSLYMQMPSVAVIESTQSSPSNSPTLT